MAKPASKLPMTALKMTKRLFHNAPSNNFSRKFMFSPLSIHHARRAGRALKPKNRKQATSAAPDIAQSLPLRRTDTLVQLGEPLPHFGIHRLLG